MGTSGRLSSLAPPAVRIGGIGVIGPIVRLAFGPMPPMVPMVLVRSGLLESIGRRAPLPGGRLPGEDEAGHARAGKLFESEMRVLASASLRVQRLLHVVMELADGDGLVACLSHQIANRSATACRRPSRSFASLDPLVPGPDSRARARDRAPIGTIARSCRAGGRA